jgi:hypothetical protein
MPDSSSLFPRPPRPRPAADSSRAKVAARAARGLAEFALAETADALDPAHPTNATLHNRGVGRVPAVVANDPVRRRAIVAAEAIHARFGVPHGWHAIDDGRRVLVFDPSGEVQINLNLLPREGRREDEMLDAIEAEARGSYAAPVFSRIRKGTLHGLGVRGLDDGGQSLEQHHLLVPGRGRDFVLRARVTATPERSAMACRLAECMLKTMDFDRVPDRPPHEPAPSDKPAWWHEARALEAAGKLKEAEQVIRNGVPPGEVAASIADLYAGRMLRLRQAGDTAGATAAYMATLVWTSEVPLPTARDGGRPELSRERDLLRERLRTPNASDFVPVEI